MNLDLVASHHLCCYLFCSHCYHCFHACHSAASLLILSQAHCCLRAFAPAPPSGSHPRGSLLHFLNVCEYITYSRRHFLNTYSELQDPNSFPPTPTISLSCFTFFHLTCYIHYLFSISLKYVTTNRTEILSPLFISTPFSA